MYTSSNKKMVEMLAQSVLANRISAQTGRYLVAKDIAATIVGRYGEAVMVRPILKTLHSEAIHPVHPNENYETMDGLAKTMNLLEQLSTADPMVRDSKELIDNSITDFNKIVKPAETLT